MKNINLDPDDKIPLIINDFVVHEDICNANCDYCLTDGSKLKADRNIVRENGVIQFSQQTKELLNYETGSILYQKLNTVLDHLEQRFDIPILKISGGEIFLIDNIIDLISERASHYTAIQVLTNGTLLNEEKISRLARIPNLHVQFPLDGHTLAMNSCRVSNDKVQNKLLKNLDLLIKYHIPVEINCVLTKVNMSHFEIYLDYLLKYASRLIVFFLPVRFKPAQRLFPEQEQIEQFKLRVLDQYQHYQAILPPEVYIEESYHFLTNRKRRIGCLIPLTIMQSFDDGIITPCPNRWTTVFGSLLADDPQQVMDKVCSDRVYQTLLDHEKPKLPFCRRCYTPYDILNYYLFDLIDLNEFKSLKLFNYERVIKNLNKIKAVYRANQYHFA